MRRIIAQNLTITIVAKLLSLVSFIYIARVLTKNEYGTFVYVSMLISLLPISQLGTMHGALVLLPKYLATKEKESGDFFQTFNQSSHVLHTLSLLSLFLIETSFRTHLILIIFVHLFLSKYSENILLYLNALHEFKKANILKLVDQVIRPIIVITLFIKFNDIESIFIGHLITSFFLLLLSIYFKRPTLSLIKIEKSSNYLIETLKVGLPIYIVWVIDLLFRSSDKWFISQYYAIQHLASYGFVSALAMNIWLLALSYLGPYSQKLYTFIAKSDFKGAGNLIDDVNKKLYVLVLSISILAILFYPIMVNLVIHKYYDTHLTFSLLVIASALLSINNMYIYYMISNNLSHVLIKYQTIILIIQIILNFYISFNHLDVSYFAYATILSLGIYSLLVRRFYKHDISLKVIGNS
ncbi:lipopolysaccharide biosynthesis protein [Methylophilus sp. 14]|uniref:lipopolysaccharide biosynthesis protein n=1 Tax=Methylophilus sp. 14 TaxID=2781019 RepID=UPI00188F05C1|nr:oligosaccharide flippase family protein [Methylophilus sp. 14]MBF4988681.1 oligosaccharide flippase family protein [Methylophilus sp. 14]